MLVLTRRPGEAIRIGDDIEIKVVSVKGDQIKIGIQAPNHVEIHRQEVYITIQEENQSASVGVENVLSILSANKELDQS